MWDDVGSATTTQVTPPSVLRRTCPSRPVASTVVALVQRTAWRLFVVTAGVTGAQSCGVKVAGSLALGPPALVATKRTAFTWRSPLAG